TVPNPPASAGIRGNSPTPSRRSPAEDRGCVSARLLRARAPGPRGTSRCRHCFVAPVQWQCGTAKVCLCLAQAEAEGTTKGTVRRQARENEVSRFTCTTKWTVERGDFIGKPALAHPARDGIAMPVPARRGIDRRRCGGRPAFPRAVRAGDGPGR